MRQSLPEGCFFVKSLNCGAIRGLKCQRTGAAYRFHLAAVVTSSRYLEDLNCHWFFPISYLPGFRDNTGLLRKGSSLTTPTRAQDVGTTT